MVSFIPAVPRPRVIN